MPVITAMQEDFARMPQQNHEILSEKQLRQKSPEDMVPVAEHLPGKHKVLSSNSSTAVPDSMTSDEPEEILASGGVFGSPEEVHSSQGKLVFP
jgi:hypothetical protein